MLPVLWPLLCQPRPLPLGPTPCCALSALQLILRNDIPTDWPAVLPGISIHFHGWRMQGNPWCGHVRGWVGGWVGGWVDGWA
jgi:hypothetical protein